ncbi:MAG: RagB/SusD family nutrient uptake outer membrane protein [Bacteroidales bacterium]
MKRYISIPILLGFLCLGSCSEDFLERYPLDELSPQQYFKSANDLKLYANSFYTLLPVHQMYYGGTFYTDQNSDNLVPAVADMRLSGIRTIPSTGGGWDWSNIREANYFLDHTKEFLDATDESILYIAEVKFFKAYLYFHMLKTFGDVPWFTSALTTDSPELFAPRDSRKVVVDSIIACLDDAIATLKKLGETEPSRINRESALLLKARICLYEGTWEKYHQGTPFGVADEDGTGFLEMASETAESLMQMGTAGLYKGPDQMEYGSLFNQLDYTGNPEVLLWKEYDVNLGVYHLLGQYLPNGGGEMGITKSLVDDYLCTDGLPVSVSPLFMGRDSILLEVQNRDPRLAQTIFLPNDPQTIHTPPGVAERYFTLPPIDQAGQFRATTGYCLYKGVNPEYSQQQASGGWMGSIIFRYSEALLIYAEAKAELGTITQQDVDISVNLLRGRVGMIPMDLGNIATDPDWDYPNLSPVINEIRRERRVELAFEAGRWDDLARWRAHHLIRNQRPKGILYVGSNLDGAYFKIDGSGQPSIIVGENLYVDEEGFIDPYQVQVPNGFGFDPDRDYLAPIPSDELTLNQNLVQNPGWK